VKFQSAPGLAKLGTGLLTALAVAVIIAGCGGGSSYGGGGGGGGGCAYGPCPTTPPTSAATDCSVAPASPVTIDLYYGIASCTDKTFGMVEGFSTDNAHSQVIKVASGSNVQFMATVNGPHSADLLGASFPASDTNPETASAAGTDISTANFSTGTLNDGQMSAVYHAAVAGMYFFGCHFHYSLGMRTVIIVQ
jgi:plastocyanin